MTTELPTRPSWLETLGARVTRRPEPRLGVAVAAVGCALAVIGVLTISGDALAGDGGDGNQVPGIVLSAIVLAAGYALLIKAPNGPLSTAGVVASALAVPPLVFFLTYDENDFPPFSIAAVLGVSALVWLASYATGPGRGHSFYLGAGVLALWLFVLELVESPFTAPFDLFGAVAGSVTPGFDGDVGDAPFGTFDAPDPETLGVLSLLFGLGYLVAARALDRSGRAGMATPFTLGALVATPIGIGLFSDTLGDVGVGIVLVVLGLVFAAHGATVGRRITTWLGAVAVAYGWTILAAEIVGDDASATTVGSILIVFGLALVAFAWWATAAFREPLETVPVASSFTRPGGGRGPSDDEPPAPAATWAPPAPPPPSGPPATPPPRPDLPPPPASPPGAPEGPPPGAF